MEKPDGKVIAIFLRMRVSLSVHIRDKEESKI